VSKQLELVYLASCPFCEYRELFSSELAMAIGYGAHLLGHEGEPGQERRPGRKGVAERMEAAAQHLQRVNSALYN